MRVVFMGTGEFAVPALKALADSEYDIALAISQPNKPKGRGLRIGPTPVARVAAECGIVLWQPPSLKDEKTRKTFLSYEADIAVVAAYGKILPDWVFTEPPFGAINIHGSLLPAYRGAAPVQRAVMNGDAKTGVTILKVAREVDTGDVLMEAETDIEADETSGELFSRLADLGAIVLPQALKLIETGKAVWRPQAEGATYAPKIEKSEALVKWNNDAIVIKNLVRGMNPNPGAFFLMNGKRVKLWRATALPDNAGEAPGAVLNILPAGPVIAAGDGAVLLSEVQQEGRARMSGAEFARGCRIVPGDMLE